MAFQSSLLPSVAASTVDFLRPISNSLAFPWKTPSSRPQTQQTVFAAAKPEPKASIDDLQPLQQSQSAKLPDFFANAPIDVIRRVPTPALHAAAGMRGTISDMSRPALLAANPILRRPFFQPAKPVQNWTRTFASAPTPRLFLDSRRALLAQSPFASQHRRNFMSTGGVPRSQLATVEEQANKNPGNANLQNVFYQLLLRANMPGILVERYQTRRFATNPATDESYNKALSALNAGGTAAGVNSGAIPAQGQASHHSDGASTVGSQSGNTSGPIPVVITESRASYIFRWFKFIANFVLITYLSFALLTIIIDYFVTFRKGPGGGKLNTEVRAEKQKTRLTDVQGCDEAKEELQEVIEFLRNPEKFTDLGAKLPKGVLLVGPPGTGKTLLARAIAGEADVPFFYMSGSEFDEVYVGVGAKRVRDLFNAAKAKSPAIVFIDELDAIGGIRNPKDQAYTKQTLNQLLTELDGFHQDSQIVIIGATNLPGSLDQALTRPGRFDRHVNVTLPDVRGRLAILRLHAKKIKLAPNVDLEAIAARTPGNSGAELENMLNVAALRASKAKSSVVSPSDLEWAYDRVTMGSERKSMVLQEEEKLMTAYHEAGHALVMLYSKETDRSLYKVTILPKGPSLGHTAMLPQMDKYSTTASEYGDMIKTCLGGKVAEELRYGNDKCTSGVSSDLQRATDIAFQMVSSLGMSDLLGPMEYARRWEHLSSETRAKVESEVQRLMTDTYGDVKKLLSDHRKELDLLAHALIDYETLDRAEVEKVIRGETLPNRPKLPKGPLVVPVPEQPPSVPEGIGGGIAVPPAAVPPTAGGSAPPAPTAPSD